MSNMRFETDRKDNTGLDVRVMLDVRETAGDLLAGMLRASIAGMAMREDNLVVAWKGEADPLYRVAIEAAWRENPHRTNGVVIHEENPA